MEAHGRVEIVGGQDVLTGIRQLHPHEHGPYPGEQEEQDHGDEVLDADDLVIGVEAEIPCPAGCVLDARLAAEPFLCPGGPATDPEQPSDERDHVAQRDHGLPGRILAGDPREDPAEEDTRAQADPGKQEASPKRRQRPGERCLVRWVHRAFS